MISELFPRDLAGLRSAEPPEKPSNVPLHLAATGAALRELALLPFVLKLLSEIIPSVRERLTLVSDPEGHDKIGEGVTYPLTH
jgi:hypothetical protein